MAYEVLARKWRPQQFDDVVGQEHVTETLKNAITNQRVAHAYLFVGPRGIGKTSSARIFAKALNCEKGPSVTPCDKCDACKEIMAGNSLDVIEIDGASNTGVDNIRGLRENVQFSPARGPYKIYIIDEVHMLSIGAFNALLKTLEEPPSHVKFFFATTEPQKVPATILSRCQRFDLRRIATKAIMERLAEIAEGEKVKIEEDALFAIARGAEGGLRDAESALDQLIAFKGKDITESDVLSVFGLVARKSLSELAGAVIAGDIPRLIHIVHDLDEHGKDMQRLILELLEYFRNLLICIYAEGDTDKLDISENIVEELSELASKTEPARVLRVVQVLSDAEGRLRYALSKRTLLEIALIRAARAARVVSIEEIIKQVEALKAGGGVYAPSPVAMSQTSLPETARKPSSEPAAAPEERTEEIPAKPIQYLTTHWHDLVERVGQLAPLAKGYLIDAKPVRVADSVVTLGFDPEFAANVEKIDHSRNRKAIEKVLSDLLHGKVKVAFQVLDAKSTLPGDMIIAKAAEETQPGELSTDPEEKRSILEAKRHWQKNETVRKTLEMFNGDIEDIRE
ncbi:MAG: DNA polymerase III subunit gamma/tau [Verrucomicrobia bacterium]|nr:DNA polymerase III subunit gamma/tau [Verrucomicrobiota bacterium]